MEDSTGLPSLTKSDHYQPGAHLKIAALLFSRTHGVSMHDDVVSQTRRRNVADA